MARVVKKRVKLPISSDDTDLADLFNQMVGSSAANIHITYARYKRIRETIDKIIKVVNMFNESPFMKGFTEFAEYRVEIDAFVHSARKSCETLFTFDFDRYELNLDLVPDDARTAFAEAYPGIKNSNLVNGFIILCDRLFPYKRYLQNAEALSGKFINSIPGTSFEPFPFSTFNLKLAYNVDGVTAMSQQFVLNVLQKLFELCHILYREVTSPDINVEDMTHVIMSNMNSIRNLPELSRCGKAFKKIEESVELLQRNFNDYYRDFISTKKGTIMVEHFVADVAKNTTSDAETRAQFFRIIRFYRKMAQSQKQDPKIERLFERLDEGFKIIERGAENIVSAREFGDGAEN